MLRAALGAAARDRGRCHRGRALFWLRCVVAPWRERRAARGTPTARASPRSRRALRATGSRRSRSASWSSIPSSCWRLRAAGRAQVDRQFRHPDPDLRHARLGPEHRRRPRRPARSRLRRLLRGRRLFLRAARQDIRPVVLDLLPLAGILAAFWGILLGFPVLRLRGDYLAIVTLAFGEIIRLVLINWVASPTAMPASPASRGRPSSAFRSTPATTASPRSSGSSSRPIYRTHLPLST